MEICNWLFKNVILSDLEKLITAAQQEMKSEEVGICF